MKALVERAIALRIGQQMKTASLGAFKQVLLQDGTSLAVHKAWPKCFREGSRPLARRQSRSYAHVSLEQRPVCMQVSADTASERQFLPEPERLNNSPLLADAGYIDMAYFAKVNEAGGFIWSG